MSATIEALFKQMRLELPERGSGLAVENPTTGETLFELEPHGAADAERVTSAACEAFVRLRKVPAPVRGEWVRRWGLVLREHKDALASVVSLEAGKGFEEAKGEVQEMIDICDYAAGMSRAIGGRTLFSERPGHRMFEQWHPLGPVLTISAFNLPVAVWAWNAAIAIICGDPVIWKPSAKTPLSAIATHQLLAPVLEAEGHGDALQLIYGPDDTVGTTLVEDARIPLVSATGSCRMGRIVAPKVAARLGRCLLELGGNNAIIVDKSANLDLAARGIAFGAAGTAGQRCTTTRRLFVEQPVLEPLLAKIVAGYKGLLDRIGDPLDTNNLVGPLVDADAKAQFVAAVAKAKELGGEVLVGGEIVDRPGHFVQPTVIRVPDHGEFAPMMEETFAPILYVRAFAEGALEEAIDWQNAVEQGLSSSIFSDSVLATERFLSADGSDCGIANVNIGTSGAEIGGAFGGEKATGGGREAGSDSWKAYMRRQTCTVNGSGALPLAQGISWE